MIGIAIVAAVLLPLIVFGGAYTHVSSESSVTQPQQTDAIVVLGSGSIRRKPSPVLKARLEPWTCFGQGRHHASSRLAANRLGPLHRSGVGRSG